MEDNCKSGFDCEFVEKPPKSIQSECPVCLLVLREPYQVTCCGYSFCFECIGHITKKDNSSPCPCCNSSEFNTFPNKGLQRSLNDYKVFCPNKERECGWSGELLDLDKHLNMDPKEQEQLKGCQYVEIKCLYCSQLIKRSLIYAHQLSTCPKRPYTCIHCKSFKGSYDAVVSKHWPECSFYPTACPNKCGKTFKRENINLHRMLHCPLEPVECDFQHVGCTVKLNRKDKEEHLEKNVASHLLLQTKSYKELREENKLLQNQIAELSKDVQALKEVIEFKGDTQLLPSLPINSLRTVADEKKFTLENFSRHKKSGDTWYSQPFYSHPKGYKLCLRVRTCGEGKGKGTHVSVFVNLMQGEFDDNLKWPFTGRITVRLVNQENDDGHVTNTVNFTGDTASVDTSYRVTDRPKARKGRGAPSFITHDKLSPNFLKNDCIFFEITSIEL